MGNSFHSSRLYGFFCELRRRKVWRVAAGCPDMTQTLAEVYALVGEQEKAIDLLDGLLSRPSPVTVAILKCIPIWNPLRDNPRFIELLKKYGGSA